MILVIFKAKVDKLEVEGDKLRAQLEKKSSAKKATTSKNCSKETCQEKLLLKKAVKAVAEEVKAK